MKKWLSRVRNIVTTCPDRMKKWNTDYKLILANTGVDCAFGYVQRMGVRPQCLVYDLAG